MGSQEPPFAVARLQFESFRGCGHSLDDRFLGATSAFFPPHALTSGDSLLCYVVRFDFVEYAAVIEDTSRLMSGLDGACPFAPPPPHALTSGVSSRYRVVDRDSFGGAVVSSDPARLCFLAPCRGKK